MLGFDALGAIPLGAGEDAVAGGGGGGGGPTSLGKVFFSVTISGDWSSELMSRVPIDEVVHFDVVTHNPSSGAISDADSTPTFEVFEEATDTDIGVGGNLTKRTSKTGNYRGTFTASAANGFEAGKWYAVIASATVGGVAAKTVAKAFMVVPAESAAGVPKVDVSHFGGSAGTFASGLPDANAASLKTQAKADVNAEVVDALNVDAYAEPGQGAPAATLSLAAKINYLFKGWRNEWRQSASQRSLMNDAGTVVDQKASVSQASGTVTVSKIGSGP